MKQHLYIGIIALIMAIGLAAIAAFFSISGLAALFQAEMIAVIIMAAGLEMAKLIVTAWLKIYWPDKSISSLVKGYLTFAVIILMVITSLGIFGFLSKGHIEQEIPLSQIEMQISNIEDKIEYGQKRIEAQKQVILSSESREAQLDAIIQTLIDSRRIRGVGGANDTRDKQNEERTEIKNVISGARTNIESIMSEVAVLQNDLSDIKTKTAGVEAKLGPVKYVAKLVGVDDTGSAVRVVIFLIMIAFDPVAVILVIAALISFSRYQEEKQKLKNEETKLAEEERSIQILESKLASYDEKIKFIDILQHNVSNKDKLIDELLVKTSSLENISEQNNNNYIKMINEKDRDIREKDVLIDKLETDLAECKHEHKNEISLLKEEIKNIVDATTKHIFNPHITNEINVPVMPPADINNPVVINGKSIVNEQQKPLYTDIKPDTIVEYTPIQNHDYITDNNISFDDLGEYNDLTVVDAEVNTTSDYNDENEHVVNDNNQLDDDATVILDDDLPDDLLVDDIDEFVNDDTNNNDIIEDIYDDEITNEDVIDIISGEISNMVFDNITEENEYIQSRLKDFGIVMNDNYEIQTSNTNDISEDEYYSFGDDEIYDDDRENPYNDYGKILSNMMKSAIEKSSTSRDTVEDIYKKTYQTADKRIIEEDDDWDNPHITHNNVGFDDDREDEDYNTNIESSTRFQDEEITEQKYNDEEFQNLINDENIDLKQLIKENPEMLDDLRNIILKNIDNIPTSKVDNIIEILDDQSDDKPPKRSSTSWIE